MGVFEAIETVFRDMGFDVASQPQEKPDPRQVIVELDTVRIEVETPTTYRMTPKVTIFFYATTGKDVLEKVVKYMRAVEKAVRPFTLSFKFGNPEFLVEGRAYYVALPCEYIEVIQIE